MWAFAEGESRIDAGRKHRRAKRKKGLCAHHGCHAVSGEKYRCPPCQQKSEQSRRKK